MSRPTKSGKKPKKKSQYLDDIKAVSNELFTYFTNHYEDEKTDEFWTDAISAVNQIAERYKDTDAYWYGVKYGSTILNEFQRAGGKTN